MSRSRARAPRLPYMPPNSERLHYVFVDPCGCPFGVVEASPDKPGGSPRLVDEDAAWEVFYDTRKQERDARNRGVRAVFVTHGQYQRDYCDRMGLSYRCPHV